jgi:hypothetical protein
MIIATDTIRITWEPDSDAKHSEMYLGKVREAPTLLQAKSALDDITNTLTQRERIMCLDT